MTRKIAARVKGEATGCATGNRRSSALFGNERLATCTLAHIVDKPSRVKFLSQHRIVDSNSRELFQQFLARGKVSGVVAELEQSHWERIDNNSKQALRAIRELIDYLDGVKRELCLESTRLSSEETLEYVGPAARVAVAGLVHAINFLAVCRTGIQETDLVLAKRSLLELERTSGI